MGAEAVQSLLAKLNLDDLSYALRHQAANETSFQSILHYGGTACLFRPASSALLTPVVQPRQLPSVHESNVAEGLV